MNPDKLFDYLDGKLSPADREQIEEKLMSDPQLRRQFNIARDIHRGSGGSREVIVPGNDPSAAERGGRLGRRIATAAAALVLINVLVGLAVITVKQRKPGPNAKEAEIREQLTNSLGAAAQNAMPPPTFVEEDIALSAPRAEWENVATRVIAAAEACGGSVTKGLPEEPTLALLAEIPSRRVAEFRKILLPAGAASPAPSAANDSPAPNEKTIVHVRIAEVPR
jgi:anti-sigma factor RsiW